MIIELSKSKSSLGITINIVDRPGSTKEWRALDDFPPNSGNLQINSENIEAKGCGLISCWELHKAVFEDLNIGSSGEGTNNSDSIALPAGNIHWRVISM